MSNRIDIHDLLKHVNSADITWFANLQPDVQKSLAPIVVNRWISGTRSADKLCAVNDVLNTYTFSLHRHQDLLYKLMIVASSDAKDYRWVPKKSKQSKMSESVRTISEYYGCRQSVARDYLSTLSCADVVAMADSLGYDSETITKIKGDFK